MVCSRMFRPFLTVLSMSFGGVTRAPQHCFRLAGLGVHDVTDPRTHGFAPPFLASFSARTHVTYTAALCLATCFFFSFLTSRHLDSFFCKSDRGGGDLPALYEDAAGARRGGGGEGGG